MSLDDGLVTEVQATHRVEHADGIIVYNFEVQGDHTYFVADADTSFTNPVWVHNDCGPTHTAPGMGNVTGLNGFMKRLWGQGYEFVRVADDGIGKIYKNPVTGAEVRIHKSVAYSPGNPGKTSGNWYYRYRENVNVSWSSTVAVPLE